MSEKQMTLTEKVYHVKSVINSRAATLLDVVPDPRTKDRMLRLMQNAITRNHKLLECNATSILTSLATAGAFGLEPNTPLGQCYVIPYKGQATFQMGYQGLIELARRAGTLISPGEVFENDVLEIQKGTDPFLRHIPCLRGDPGSPIGYYAVAYTAGDGKPYFDYWSMERCIEHGRKYSQAFSKSDSPWKTATGPMCMKTMIVQVSKYSPRAIYGDLLSVDVPRMDGVEGAHCVSALAADGDVDIPSDVDATLDIPASEVNEAPAPDVPKMQGELTPKDVKAARDAAGVSAGDFDAASKQMYDCCALALDGAKLKQLTDSFTQKPAEAKTEQKDVI